MKTTSVLRRQQPEPQGRPVATSGAQATASRRSATPAPTPIGLSHAQMYAPPQTLQPAPPPRLSCRTLIFAKRTCCEFRTALPPFSAGRRRQHRPARQSPPVLTAAKCRLSSLWYASPDSEKLLARSRTIWWTWGLGSAGQRWLMEYTGCRRRQGPPSRPPGLHGRQAASERPEGCRCPLRAAQHFRRVLPREAYVHPPNQSTECERARRMRRKWASNTSTDD